MLQLNVGRADQIIRIVLGATLFGMALFCPWTANFGAIVTWPAGIIGAVLLVTGFSRRCPAYTLIGTNTDK